jgi:hypothetical protein
MSDRKNSIRQVYEVRQGTVEAKLVTSRGLSGEELSSFRTVIDAIEQYAKEHPPEFLADIAKLPRPEGDEVADDT